MATRKKKTTKRRIARGGRSIVIIGVGRRVYVAPLSALGRPVRNRELNKLIAALKGKSRKCCHGTSFCGVYTHPMYMRSFGNGHMPD